MLLDRMEALHNALIAVLREPPSKEERAQCAIRLEDERCRLAEERAALDRRCDKLEAKIVKLHEQKQTLRAQYQLVLLLRGRLESDTYGQD